MKKKNPYFKTIFTSVKETNRTTDNCTVPAVCSDLSNGKPNKNLTYIQPEFLNLHPTIVEKEKPDLTTLVALNYANTGFTLPQIKTKLIYPSYGVQNTDQLKYYIFVPHQLGSNNINPTEWDDIIGYIFNVVDLGILVMELDTFNVVYNNNILKQMLGYASWDNEMVTVQDILTPSEINVLRTELVSNGKNKCIWKYKQIFQPDKSTVTVDLILLKFRINTKNYVIGIVKDLGEYTKIKILVDQLYTQLLTLQKRAMLGDITAGIIHDLNNGLTIIQGNIELLKSEIPSSHPGYIYLQEVSQVAKYITDLNRQLITNQTLPVPGATIDLNQTIIGLAKLYKRIVGKKISIEYQLTGALEDITIPKIHLEQILMNLILNARDAMLPQGGKITIQTERVTVQPETDTSQVAKSYVCLSFTDTGIGFKQDEVANLFSPYYTTKGNGKGTGLGLFVIEYLVKENGGWINVASKHNVGTTFKIYLPAYDTAT